MQAKPQAYNNLGLSYYEQNDPEEAAAQFSKAISIEKNLTNEHDGSSKEYLSLYLNNRGLAHYHQGLYEDALADYNAAIEAINGTNAENFFNRGNVYLNQGKYEEAHEDFDTAISLDKSSAKLHHAKGLAFQSEADALAKSGEDLERQEELVQYAIQSFDNALACDSCFISSMFHQGLMYRRITKYKEALVQFSAVMK